MQACHYPDRNVNNNREDNLCWGTPETNQRHRREHGTHMSGVKCPWTKITKARAKRMLVLWKSGEYRQKELMAIFEVSEATIKKVCQGRHWTSR